MEHFGSAQPDCWAMSDANDPERDMRVLKKAPFNLARDRINSILPVRKLG